jgi:hypothetical protein
MHYDEDDATQDLRRWLGEDDAPASAGHDAVDDPPRRWTPPRVALALLVLAPWVVLTALAVSGGPGPPMTARSADGTGPEGAAPDHPGGASTGGASTPADGAGQAHAGGGDTAVTGAVTADDAVPDDAAPTAVRLVRDTLTRAGDRSVALDIAAAEKAETLTAGTWAVRVHTVVLRGDRRRWHTATHEIWVAPVGLREGRMVGLDRPWRVATVDDAIASTTWDRARVDIRAVRDALDDAGIGYGDDLVVQQHPAAPSILRVTTNGTRRVWVRLTPEPVVVGHDHGTRDR